MTCSKIFSGDLPELTNEIIQYFQNDLSTLYSCILVNRTWCRLAIPLLWEDPFSSEFPKNYHFIEIYLDKLNDDDKIKIIEYGVNDYVFPSNTLLFNYPNFIKCLNTQKIVLSIEAWIKYATTSKVIYYSEITGLVCLIYSSLIKIFIENEANLHTFEVEAIYITGNLSNDYLKSVFQLILQNPNFICNVKNLTINSYELNSILLSFLKFIYSKCNYVSSLFIHYSDIYSEDFSKIINSQRNLKKIYFKYDFYPLESLKNSNYSNTLKTLIFDSINLKSLEVNFNEVFEQLKVLESIHILCCVNLNSVAQQIINLTRPFKLKSLLMNDETMLQIEPLKLLLQKAGNYLENIEFQTSMNYKLELKLFELIKIYCNKIKIISFLDCRNTFPAFDLIKNIQQNLSYLIIYFCEHYLCYDDGKLGSIILQNLGQILPYRLEYLSLAFRINTNDLKVFFKNSKNIFIKKLLIKNKFYEEGVDILPCIKKYVMKEKRVTYLALENYSSIGIKKDLSDLKNEVEEFKFYGIQVTNYNVLSIQIYDYIINLY
jgi:hypothetical protein